MRLSLFDARQPQVLYGTERIRLLITPYKYTIHLRN